MRPDKGTDLNQMEKIIHALRPGQTGLFRASSGNLNYLHGLLERNFRKPQSIRLSYVQRWPRDGHLVLVQKEPWTTKDYALPIEELPAIDIDLTRDAVWCRLLGKEPRQ